LKISRFAYKAWVQSNFQCSGESTESELPLENRNQQT